METVTKAWEDSFLFCSITQKECTNGLRCKGHTARTVHGRSLGRALGCFALPSGRSFDFCLLCIRASVSAKWYEVLYTHEMPQEPIHAWTVEVDKEGEYDAAVCIGPLQCHQYVGVVGAFPRYDETTLLVCSQGFTQVGMDFRMIPRLLKPNERVGARPLGFHWLWRTTYALLYAGYICRTSDTQFPGHVAEIFSKCIPRSQYGNTKWDTSNVQKWVDGVVKASALGIYPHCKVRYAALDITDDEWTPKHVLFFLREHITFLIEKDSPELRDAVIRAYPQWPTFEASVRETCDVLRRRVDRVVSKRVQSVKRFEDIKSWSAYIKENTEEPRYPAFSSLLPEMKQKFYEGEDAMAWMHALPMSDASALYRAAAWDVWKDRFATRKILVPKNQTDEPIGWYMCSSCGSFKSVTTTKWGGCNEVCLDLSTMKVLCHKKRGVGRKPLLTHIEKSGCTEFTTSGCRGEIIRKKFGSNIVNIDFSAYVACVKCKGALVPLDFRRTVLGYVCDECTKPHRELECEVCATKVASDAFCVQAFDPTRGMRSVYFCRAHARPKLRKHADVWSLDLLMSTIYNSKRIKM